MVNTTGKEKEVELDFSLNSKNEIVFIKEIKERK